MLPHDTLECYPKFPREIQTMIWKLVAFVPRIVEVKPKDRSAKDGRCFRDIFNVNEVMKYCSATPVPAMMHVCREARSEALKHYEPCLTYDESSKIYLNLAVDIPFFSRDAQQDMDWSFGDFLLSMRQVHMQKKWSPPISRIAIDLDAFGFLESSLYCPKDRVFWPALEEVIIARDSRLLDRDRVASARRLQLKLLPAPLFKAAPLAEPNLYRDCCQKETPGHIEFPRAQVLVQAPCCIVEERKLFMANAVPRRADLRKDTAPSKKADSGVSSKAK